MRADGAQHGRVRHAVFGARDCLAHGAVPHGGHALGQQRGINLVLPRPGEQPPGIGRFGAVVQQTRKSGLRFVHAV